MGEAKIEAAERAAAEERYQLCAGQADNMGQIVLKALDEAFPDIPEAAVAGLLTAMVRHHVQKTREPGQPVIVRDVTVTLTPGLHRAAERVVKAVNLLDQVPLANPS